MRPLPVPDDKVLCGATHELLAIWARIEEDKQTLLLKYAWSLMPEKRRGEVRSISGYERGERATGDSTNKKRRL
jgi:hypothetical protein